VAGTRPLRRSAGSRYSGLTGSDPEFDRRLQQVLELMRSDSHYVPGAADQVPADGLERRLRRVGKLAELYGVYGGQCR
jgi:hypothetical protein